MKLNDALQLRNKNQHLARKKWINQGARMVLIDSAKTIKDLQVELTDESLNADDWGIYNVE